MTTPTTNPVLEALRWSALSMSHERSQSLSKRYAQLAERHALQSHDFDSTFERVFGELWEVDYFGAGREELSNVELKAHVMDSYREIAKQVRQRLQSGAIKPADPLLRPQNKIIRKFLSELDGAGEASDSAELIKYYTPPEQAGKEVHVSEWYSEGEVKAAEVFGEGLISRIYQDLPRWSSRWNVKRKDGVTGTAYIDTDRNLVFVRDDKNGKAFSNVARPVFRKGDIVSPEWLRRMTGGGVPLDEADYRKAADLLNSASSQGSQAVEDAMRQANKILDLYGVEGITPDGEVYPQATYINTGDTYSATIVYDIGEKELWQMSWGDWLEKWETEHQSAAGDDDKEMAARSAWRKSGPSDIADIDKTLKAIWNDSKTPDLHKGAIDQARKADKSLGRALTAITEALNYIGGEDFAGEREMVERLNKARQEVAAVREWVSAAVTGKSVRDALGKSSPYHCEIRDEFGDIESAATCNNIREVARFFREHDVDIKEVTDKEGRNIGPYGAGDKNYTFTYRRPSDLGKGIYEPFDYLLRSLKGKIEREQAQGRQVKVSDFDRFIQASVTAGHILAEEVAAFKKELQAMIDGIQTGRAPRGATAFANAARARLAKKKTIRPHFRKATYTLDEVAEEIMRGQGMIQTEMGKKNIRGVRDLILNQPAEDAARIILNGQKQIRLPNFGLKTLAGLTDLLKNTVP